MFSNPQLYPLVPSPTHNSNLVSQRRVAVREFLSRFPSAYIIKRVRAREPRKVPVLRRWNLHIINSINVGGGEQKFRSNVYFSPSLDPTSQPLNRARYYRALLNIQRYARVGEWKTKDENEERVKKKQKQKRIRKKMFSCSRERRDRNVSGLKVVMECTHDNCDRWHWDAYVHIAKGPNNKT